MTRQNEGIGWKVSCDGLLFGALTCTWICRVLYSVHYRLLRGYKLMLLHIVMEYNVRASSNVHLDLHSVHHIDYYLGDTLMLLHIVMEHSVSSRAGLLWRCCRSGTEPSVRSSLTSSLSTKCRI